MHYIVIITVKLSKQLLKIMTLEFLLVDEKRKNTNCPSVSNPL